MKKYLVLLPLAASCTGLSEYNMNNQEGKSNQEESVSNVPQWTRNNPNLTTANQVQSSKVKMLLEQRIDLFKRTIHQIIEKVALTNSLEEAIDIYNAHYELYLQIKKLESKKDEENINKLMLLPSKRYKLIRVLKLALEPGDKIIQSIEGKLKGAFKEGDVFERNDLSKIEEEAIEKINKIMLEITNKMEADSHQQTDGEPSVPLYMAVIKIQQGTEEKIDEITKQSKLCESEDMLKEKQIAIEKTASITCELGRILETKTKQEEVPYDEILEEIKEAEKKIINTVIMPFVQKTGLSS